VQYHPASHLAAHPKPPIICPVLYEDYNWEELLPTERFKSLYVFELDTY